MIYSIKASMRAKGVPAADINRMRELLDGKIAGVTEEPVRYSWRRCGLDWGRENSHHAEPLKKADGPFSQLA